MGEGVVERKELGCGVERREGAYGMSERDSSHCQWSRHIVGKHSRLVAIKDTLGIVKSPLSGGERGHVW